MILKGSCHCQAVRFEVNSSHPYPYNLCYCSICRKTAGSGGFGINLSADHTTLTIDGEQNISIYQAKITDLDGKLKTSEARRHFCSLCGSALWVWDPRWPQLMHPFASSIDSELPAPPERTHLMLGSKPHWVEPAMRPEDQSFDQYPAESIADWHRRLGLEHSD